MLTLKALKLRSKVRRRVTVVVSATALAVTLAACGSSGDEASSSSSGLQISEGWDAVVSAAQDEGKVVFYTSLDPDRSNALEKAFEKAYPDIDATFARGASGEMITRLDQEREHKLGGADVAIVTEGRWYDERSQAKELIDLKDMPNVDKWSSAPASDYLKGGYVGAELIPIQIAWNPKYVKTPLTDYTDVLRPEFKGKVGTPDLIATSISAWYAHLEKTYGADFISDLAKQKPRLYQSTTPLAQATVAGEVWVDMFAPGAIFKAYESQGADIKVVAPDPAISTAMWAGALSYADHPNAAAVMLNFLLGTDGQAALNGDGYGISALGAQTVPTSIDAKPLLLQPEKLSDADIAAIAKRVGPLLGSSGG